MKTRDARRNPDASMRRCRRVDFLFVGMGVTPLALMLGGHPAMAMLLLIPLLLAACLYGMWEQVESRGEPCQRPADSRERRGASSQPMAGVALREHGEAGDRRDCQLPDR